MPKAWSKKDERQYEHIKKSAKQKGRSAKRAKEIAARTVNTTGASRTERKNNRSQRCFLNSV
jgi:hypothetical protein